jgi:hypothetical protein
MSGQLIDKPSVNIRIAPSDGAVHWKVQGP